GIRFGAIKDTSSAAPRALQLRITPMYGLRWANPARFRVGGVSTFAEAGDLGRRIAGAAGLGYERVVTRDSRELSLDFRAAADPGFQPVGGDAPEPAEPAARAPAPRATSRFDPATLDADFRVAVWRPGWEVRLRRPFGAAAIGCLPGVLLVL